MPPVTASPSKPRSEFPHPSKNSEVQALSIEQPLSNGESHEKIAWPHGNARNRGTKEEGSLEGEISSSSKVKPSQEQAQHHSGSLASIATLCNSAVGAGVLSLPYAFSHAGLIGGFVLCLAIGLVEGFTLWVLAKFSEHTGQATYSTLVKSTLGGGLSAILAVVLVVQTFGIRIHTRLSNMYGVIFIGIAFIMAGYLSVGASGYIAHPLNMSSNVLNILPTTPVVQAARFVIGVVVLVHYPVTYHPGRDAFKDIVAMAGWEAASRSTLVSSAYTIVFVLGSMAVASLMLIKASYHRIDGPLADPKEDEEEPMLPKKQAENQTDQHICFGPRPDKSSMMRPRQILSAFALLLLLLHAPNAVPLAEGQVVSCASIDAQTVLLYGGATKPYLQELHSRLPDLATSMDASDTVELRSRLPDLATSMDASDTVELHSRLPDLATSMDASGTVELRSRLPDVATSIDVSDTTVQLLQLSDPEQAKCASDLSGIATLILWEDGELSKYMAYLPKMPSDSSLTNLVVYGKEGRLKAGLTDLSMLSSLQAIESLYIYNMGGLVDMKGLEQLTSIGKDLVIANNDELMSLVGLDQLEEIGEDMVLSSNMNLKSVAGLQTLQSVGGRVYIVGNGKLNSVDEMISLSSVAGSVEMPNNGRSGMSLPALVSAAAGALGAGDSSAVSIKSLAGSVLVLHGSASGSSLSIETVQEALMTFTPPVKDFVLNSV
eukprot:gene26862-4468_t